MWEEVTGHKYDNLGPAQVRIMKCTHCCAFDDFLGEYGARRHLIFHFALVYHQCQALCPVLSDML